MKKTPRSKAAINKRIADEVNCAKPTEVVESKGKHHEAQAQAQAHGQQGQAQAQAQAQQAGGQAQAQAQAQGQHSQGQAQAQATGRHKGPKKPRKK